jgi:tagatose 1,6-diphosphate aldolase
MATQTQAKVRMTRGKMRGINAIANDQGVITAAAMDQRGSLQKAIGKAMGHDATAENLTEFKTIVTEVLTPYASAILMDPEYGLSAIEQRAPGVGVLLAYEKTGYDATVKGRLPDLLPNWSVRRLVEAGANAIKILLYYDPDDDPAINRIKQAFIERVGAECRAYQVPFFLEPLAYSDAVGDEKGFEFARVKPDKVRKYMAEFSQPQYGVDVLKVEVPVNMSFVEGTQANTSGNVAYTRQEALQHFREAAAATRVPFSGVLCGRATWQDGIPVYGKEGPDALRAWLLDRGVANIQALNRVVALGAKPWWDFYGGLDNIEVIDLPE